MSHVTLFAQTVRTTFALCLIAFVACTGSIGNQTGQGDDDQDDGKGDGGSSGGSNGRGGNAAGGSGTPDEMNACGPLPQRLWRLTPVQLENVLKTVNTGAKDVAKALEPFVTDRGTASGLALTVPHVEALVDKLGTQASAVFTARKSINACLEGAPSNDCVKQAIERLALKAFRRPPTSEEVDSYVSYYSAEKAIDGADVAFRQLTQAILLSPNTLFRFELGAKADGGKVELTGYEKASFLSFTLLDSPPDAELLESAKKGELDSKEGLAKQATRLLAAAEAGGALQRYFDETMDVQAVTSVAKDEGTYPKFTNDIRADMLSEFRAFVKEAIWRGDGRLETLLTAPHTFLNKRLGTFYGLQGGADDGTWAKADTAAQGRSGLLTLGAFLATHGLQNDTDIIRRGRFVREQLLCDELPSPPADVNAFPLPPDGVLTHRERLVAHAENPRCALCHDLMDPLGFGLEKFDGVGAYRTTDARAKKSLDVTGFLAEGDQKFSFEGARGLAKVVLEQPRAHTCFARKLEAFIAGRGLQEGGSCAADAAFVEDLRNEGVRGGLVRRFSDPAFWKRALSN
ncbi:MAG: DUF1592 domain-containing protein [Deltaproteobacteria bacterium]|nr:DUF1592 domain-containing protein [Deltaproteobacteria bacterium]